MQSSRISRRQVLGAAAATALGSLPIAAMAQSGPYPNRPIKIIMPWAAANAVASSLIDSLCISPAPASANRCSVS